MSTKRAFEQRTSPGSSRATMADTLARPAAKSHIFHKPGVEPKGAPEDPELGWLDEGKIMENLLNTTEYPMKYQDVTLMFIEHSGKKHADLKLSKFKPSMFCLRGFHVGPPGTIGD